MKILHIACGVSHSNVYLNLFSSLKNLKVEFEVYIPQHKGITDSKLAKDKFPYKYYSSEIIKPYDKILYFSKIIRMKKDIETNLGLTKISLIHSHSLFSDGGVAYEIYKKYKIPYIVAVRDTDVNKYFDKAIHLRKYAINILRNSSKIIFLSKPYKNYVISKYIPIKYQNEILNKVRIIPNGISDYWLKNKNNWKPKVQKNEETINLLCVGHINKRKNILKIIEAANLIRKRGDNKIQLFLIGKKKDKKYFKKLSKKGYFTHIPYLSKEELISYYRNSDVFVMPSLTESFGLVYAEAMSQGLPIVYTKGQGFDEQFEEGTVGYSVDALSAVDIANKIKLVYENHKSLKENCVNMVEEFSWKRISENYKQIYQNIIN